MGAFPVIFPFFIFESVNKALSTAAISVLTFLFVLGIGKARITKIHWSKSALETLTVSAISCGAGLLLGRIAAGHFH